MDGHHAYTLWWLNNTSEADSNLSDHFLVTENFFPTFINASLNIFVTVCFQIQYKVLTWHSHQ